MDVFRFRDEVGGDYAAYVRSFLHFGDERIKGYVEEELTQRFIWPAPPGCVVIKARHSIVVRIGKKAPAQGVSRAIQQAITLHGGVVNVQY